MYGLMLKQISKTGQHNATENEFNDCTTATIMLQLTMQYLNALTDGLTSTEVGARRM
jgi:hypothetical protein